MRVAVSGHVYSVKSMTGLERIRRRVPVVVFVLLLVMVVLMVGFACACFSEHPLKATEKALGGGLASLALIEMWAAIVIVLLAAPQCVGRRVAPMGRASPAALQCFLR